MDDIQAIFFEECAEGLATAEEGLSAMADGNISADVIAGVFRAVHSIKGGAGAFGHDALQSFSHCFENLLDEVRGGRIEASTEVCRAMLLAFDVLSDHVGAAQGHADLPDDAATLASLEAFLIQDSGGMAPSPASDAATTNASAPEGEDEFGFMPVAVDIEDFDQEPSAPASDASDDDGSELAPARWAVRWQTSVVRCD